MFPVVALWLSGRRTYRRTDGRHDSITTGWGKLSETVEHGRTGFRCSTLNEFVHAAKIVESLDRHYIHQRAVSRYSMDVVKWQYQTYFERLQDLWGKGWYALHDEPDERWLRGYQSC